MNSFEHKGTRYEYTVEKDEFEGGQDICVTFYRDGEVYASLCEPMGVEQILDMFRDMIGNCRKVGHTRIRRERSTNEWVVMVWDEKGERWSDADYYTNDKTDAQQTAQKMMENS